MDKRTTKTIAVRVPVELWDELQEEAREQGWLVSELVREVLRQYLASRRMYPKSKPLADVFKAQRRG